MSDTGLTDADKATPGYIASEIWGIKIGFEILREYVSGGGPQSHQDWLAETLYEMIEQAERHAETLAAASS